MQLQNSDFLIDLSHHIVDLKCLRTLFFVDGLHEIQIV